MTTPTCRDAIHRVSTIVPIYLHKLYFCSLFFSNEFNFVQLLMINLFSYTCIGVGIVFWFWGTSHLLGRRSVLFKLHSLSVADTLGSMSIIVGLLLKIPSEWPLLILAIISLAIWNTMLGYVLAYCSSSGGSND